MGISRKEFLEATRRMKEMRANNPITTAAYYNRRAKRVVISLSTGIEVMFNPSDVQGLENATPAQLSEIEISPSGFGIHFPKLDADLYVPGILEGVLGSRKWMAARLGAAGGRSRSLPKRTAARVNGALGGRPRKSAAR
jgi:uncharacterized protein DUF2442